jgi:predicted RNase H-like HicB family nuclease
MKDYHINVFYSEQDKCYVADIPDLRYCCAFGPSPDRAVREVMKAKKAWLESARREGLPIPAPKYRAATHGAKKKTTRKQ